MSAVRVLVSAGEPSGDRHAARAVAALRALAPGADVDAFGGEALARAGAHLRWPLAGRSARGLMEAVRGVPAHAAMYRELARDFRRGRYDLALLVDYPGFNLAVARAAKRAGVPVLYYIAPQLWAWGSWRTPRLRRDVQHLATVLPFEPSFFSARGVPTSFVGHPLLDQPRPDRAAARLALGLSTGAPVLGLFPGSRPAEVARHWGAFRDASRLVRRTHPQLEIIVAAQDGAEYPGAGDVIVHRGDPAVAFAAADAALCKSGTTTLEAALADTPMVVAYRMPAATYAVARRVVRVTHVGLVNLLADRPTAPELLQRDMTPVALAAAVTPLLDGAGPAVTAQRAQLLQVRERLGTPGAARRVAELALGMVA